MKKAVCIIVTLLLTITLFPYVHAQEPIEKAGFAQNVRSFRNLSVLTNSEQQSNTYTSSIPGESTPESQPAGGHYYEFLHYPAWSWMSITWEFRDPYALIVDQMGFSREEAQAIIDSDYAQSVVDNLLKKHHYFGYEASDFYDGQDVPLVAPIRQYWDSIPMEATINELRKNKETALKLAASMAVPKNSPCLSNLTKDKEVALAKAIASRLYLDSTASFASLWKFANSGYEGLDLTLPGRSAKFYSVSNGIVVRPHAKAMNSAVAVFYPQEYLSCLYVNDYSLPSVSTGKIISSGKMLGYADGRKSVYTTDKKGNYRKDSNGNFYKVTFGTGNYKKVIAQSSDNNTALTESTAIHFEIHEGYNLTEPVEQSNRHSLSPYLCLNESEYNNICMQSSQKHEFSIFTAEIMDNNKWKYILRCICGKTHTFSHQEMIKESTCNSEGTAKYFCNSPCSITGTITIQPDEHKWGEWKESKTGDSAKRKCILCGKVESLNFSAN